jgi:5-methylcytosine-specific restriction endonuclease McrA
VKSYSLSHLSDRIVLEGLDTHVAQERSVTAIVLAHIAEVDARGLYRAAGYGSMYAYCVGKLHFSEDAAYKRIQAARTARQFPAVFQGLEEGGLHLSAVLLLGPHLTEKTADDLLNAAAHKSKVEIETLLAQRLPRPDMAPRLQAIPDQLVADCAGQQLAPGRVESRRDQLAPGRVDLSERPRVSPLSPQRFALQLTMSQAMHDKLRRAQDLLGHQIPSGDVVQVLDRALDALICKLEKRKFAATAKPRSRQSAATTSDPRHIPAAVQRAVWERDGGRCTFVSDTGHRCSARKRLEFDHIQEVARGGDSTAGNLQLLCRSHYQYAAEQTYGPGFMKSRRQDAAEKRAGAAAQKAATWATQKAVEEVVPYLRALGCRAAEAREVARQCESIPDAPLAERVRLAVSRLGPRGYSPSGGLLRARPGTPAAAAPA